MKAANQQLAEWDVELNQLHERNGDLGLEVQNLKEQLEQERADREEVESQLIDREKQIEELRSQLEAELADLKQKSATARELPEAAEFYNQFKADNPKTKTTYKEFVDILARVQAVIEG